jgi:cell division protein FtsI/penicillin-binding protein 2
MYKVVNRPGGTAYKYFQIDPPSVEVCGKTGTAETWPHTADLNGNGRIDPGEKLEGSMAWCVAFAPYGNPKIAIAVVLEYVDPISGGGPKDAAPVARDIIHLCQKYGYLK